VELVQSDTCVCFPPSCDIRQKFMVPKYFCLLKWNLSIPASCTIRHISLVPWCVGLDRFHCRNRQAYKVLKCRRSCSTNFHDGQMEKAEKCFLERHSDRIFKQYFHSYMINIQCYWKKHHNVNFITDCWTSII
jgi:hypothetical protein